MAESKTVNCQQCQTEMAAQKKTDRNMTLQLLGVALFLLAIPLLIVVPIGTAAGLILMVVAGRLGYRKINVWLCPGCGYFFERDKSAKTSKAGDGWG